MADPIYDQLRAALMARFATQATPSLASLPAMKPVASHPVQTPGLLTPGNIALADRPVVHNPDGSISSVYTMGIEDEDPKSPRFGKQVNIPGVIKDASGKWYTDRDPQAKAARAYYYKTGENLGTFDTWQNASAYAQKLHEDYENGVFGQQYIPPGYTPKQK